jgi:hypothetical protein
MNNILSLDILFPIGAVLLAAALVYGMWQYRTRNRRNDDTAQRIVRERYENPSRWDGNKTER